MGDRGRDQVGGLSKLNADSLRKWVYCRIDPTIWYSVLDKLFYAEDPASSTSYKQTKKGTVLHCRVEVVWYFWIFKSHSQKILFSTDSKSSSEVVNLHFMMHKIANTKPSVLWPRPYGEGLCRDMGIGSRYLHIYHLSFHSIFFVYMCIYIYIYIYI